MCNYGTPDAQSVRNRQTPCGIHAIHAMQNLWDTIFASGSPLVPKITTNRSMC